MFYFSCQCGREGPRDSDEDLVVLYLIINPLDPSDVIDVSVKIKRLCCIGGHSVKCRNIMLCKAGLNEFRDIVVYRRTQCNIEIYKVVYRRAQCYI